jgi:CheY-like chemotaxis protein
MNGILTPLHTVLWVEDGAKYELREFLGAVHYDQKCRLELAQDASRAMGLLSKQKFDAIIADIRLPPGNHPSWQELYQKNGRNKSTARLGLTLLDWMINPASELRKTMECSPLSVEPEHVAVFTIESRYDIAEQLDTLRIPVFEQKKTTTPDTILVKIIDDLLRPKRVA